MKFKITKKICAIILSISLIAQMSIPVIYAEEMTVVKTITSFTELEGSVKNITVEEGIAESELLAKMPNVLEVQYIIATTDSAVSLNIENITWKIDPANSYSNEFNSTEAGISYTYIPNLPEKDSAGDKLTVDSAAVLPTINVNVEGSELKLEVTTNTGVKAETITTEAAIIIDSAITTKVALEIDSKLKVENTSTAGLEVPVMLKTAKTMMRSGSSNSGTHALTIMGGTEGVDWRWGGKVYTVSSEIYTESLSETSFLNIITDTPIVIGGNTTDLKTTYRDAIYILDGVNANITLDNLTMHTGEKASGYSCITVMPGGKLNLTLKGENRFSQSKDISDGSGGIKGKNMPSIRVPSGSELVITDESTGSLDAKTYSGSAVIGGQVFKEEGCGAITIDGGKLFLEADGGDANGYESGSCIGTAANSEAKTEKITIRGGEIEVYSKHGAAIGLGYAQPLFSKKELEIDIQGGMIKATTGSSRFDPIGSDKDLTEGYIEISGGNIQTSFAKERAKLSGKKLYKAVLTLEGQGAGKNISKVTYYTDAGKVDNYGVNDIKTLSHGELIVWLPENAVVTSITDSQNTSYYGCVSIKNDDTTQGSFKTASGSYAVFEGRAEHCTYSIAKTNAVESAERILLHIKPDVGYEVKGICTYEGNQPEAPISLSSEFEKLSEFLYVLNMPAGNRNLYINMESISETGDFVVSDAQGLSYKYSDKTLTFNGEGSVKVNMKAGVNTTSERIILAKDSKVSLTIEDINIDTSSGSAIDMDNLAGDCTLFVKGENSLSGELSGKAVLHVGSNATLTIRGDGFLNVNNKAKESIGIGNHRNSENISLKFKDNPTVKVNVSQDSNGIGVYWKEYGKADISIEGGNIFSIAGSGGHGIGGGFRSSAVTNISGGTVYGEAGSGNQGLGGISANGNTIYISGGSVNTMYTQPEPLNHIQPKNRADGDLLYMTIITVGSGNKLSTDAKVSELTVKNNGNIYPYGTAGMSTDAKGKLYLWLPKGTVVTKVVTENGSYKGNVETNDTLVTARPYRNIWGTAEATFELDGAYTSSIPLTVDNAYDITTSAVKVLVKGKVGSSVYYANSETEITEASQVEITSTSTGGSIVLDKAAKVIELSGLTPGKTYNYYFVSKKDGKYSEVKKLSFTTAIQITSQPQGGETVIYGYDTAPILKVSALADSTLSYEWHQIKDGDETSDYVFGGNSNTLQVDTGLAAGKYSFYCIVSCDGYSVKSEIAEFTVEKAVPRLEIAEKDINNKVFGDTVQIKAKVFDNYLQKLSGNLKLKEENEDIVTVTLNSGEGTLEWVNASTGKHSVIVEYIAPSNGNYTNEVSSIINFNIAKAEQKDFDITPIANKKFGDSPFTLETTGGNGEGEVIFSVPDGNKVLTVSGSSIVIIGVGTTTVMAIKAADNNYNSISANIAITVEKGNHAEIVFKESYKSAISESKYTGKPISNPRAEDLELTGISYADVKFIWYKESVAPDNKLAGPPTELGSYFIEVKFEGNENLNEFSNYQNFNIVLLNRVVKVLYNGEETKQNLYNDDISITATGYTVSETMDGEYNESYILKGEGLVSKDLYFKENSAGYITIAQNVGADIDRVAPVFGEADGIKIEDKTWKTLLDNITYSRIFTEGKDVTISAADDYSGVAKYYYYIDNSGSSIVKTKAELDSLTFTENYYFNFSAEGKYVIYAYVVDLAGNKSEYICTEGIILDNTTPNLTLTVPEGEYLKDISAVAKIKSTEAVTLTYILRNSAQSSITEGAILNVVDKQSVEIVEEQTDIDIEFLNLEANKTYYIYAIAKDRVGHISSIQTVNFTTTKTQPLFTDTPSLTGIYGQKVNEMTINQVESNNGVNGSWSAVSSDIPSVGTENTYDLVFIPENKDEYAGLTVKVKPNVSAKHLAAEGVTVGAITGIYKYDGVEKTPVVTVIDNKAGITQSDYSYTFSGNINAGTASITITGKNNYTGVVSVNFNIAKADAPEITFPTASNLKYGQKLSESILTGGSTEFGSFDWIETSKDMVPVVFDGNNTEKVIFTPNENTIKNYEEISARSKEKQVSFKVEKADTTLKVETQILRTPEGKQLEINVEALRVGFGTHPSGTIKLVDCTNGSDVDIVGAENIQMKGSITTYTWTNILDKSYKIKAIYSGDMNYNSAVSSEISVDMTKSEQENFKLVAIENKVYGDSSFKLTTTGGNGEGSVSFESSDSAILSIEGNIATIKKVGTVNIIAKKAGDNLYNPAETKIKINIAKKLITVKADNKTTKKGSKMPKLSYSLEGVVKGDSFTLAPSITTNAVNTNTVGKYIIKIEGGILKNAENYNINYIEGVLTIEETTSGGSTSGSSSSSESTKPNTTTAIEKETNTKPKEITIVRPNIVNGNVNVDLTQNTMLEAIKKAKEAKKNTNSKEGIVVELKVDTENSSVKNIFANLFKTSIDKLVTESVKELSVNTGAGRMNLDLETLKAIRNQVSSDVVVSAKKVDNFSLSAEAQTVVGNRPVYDFSITGENGQKVTEFGKGKINISLPYALSENEKAENLTVYYIADNGNLEEMSNIVYDEKTKTISFETNHFSKFAVGYKELTVVDAKVNFTDIANHWAKADIEYVVSRGLFGGIAKDKFAPDMAMTRGMFVTVLGRLANADVSSYTEGNFSDVKSDAYYMSYIEWANKNNIVSGISEGKFAPDTAITREQMAVIISNYLRMKEVKLQDIQSETKFEDEISSYARASVKEMQMAGILTGKKENQFDAKTQATRAEVSVVIKRLIETMK